jgi:mono/diheme cytochrome c family protein
MALLRYSLIVVLIACGAHTPVRAQEPVVPPADIEDGQRLYLGACTNCHGPDGNTVPGVDLGHGQFRRASSDAELA